MTWKPIALIALLITTGCRSNDSIDDVDINQDKLYGRYSGSFDANTKKLDLWTQFRLGGNTGTTVRLMDGKLSVNEREMSEHFGDVALINLTGTYYYLKQTVNEPESEYNIVWDRSDGVQVSNAISIPSPIHVIDAYASRSGFGHEFVIEYEGDEPIGQERVEARLQTHYGPRPPHNRGRLRKTVTAGRRIIFSAAETATIPWGSRVTVTLVKYVKSSRLEGHDAEGGLMDGRYIAEKYTIRWPR